MPNLITGLRYSSPINHVDTEEQLLEVFEDLKKEYQKLFQHFTISTPNNEIITSFKQLLKYATNTTYLDKKKEVILNGSGDIGGGIIVNTASVEYDLLDIGQITRYWDQRREGTCMSCTKRVRDNIEQEWDCGIGVRYGTKNCSKYTPFVTNSKGERASALEELIEEASLE